VKLFENSAAELIQVLPRETLRPLPHSGRKKIGTSKIEYQQKKLWNKKHHGVSQTKSPRSKPDLHFDHCTWNCTFKCTLTMRSRNIRNRLLSILVKQKSYVLSPNQLVSLLDPPGGIGISRAHSNQGRRAVLLDFCCSFSAGSCKRKR
jgi:hypothetical protein